MGRLRWSSFTSHHRVQSRGVVGICPLMQIYLAVNARGATGVHGRCVEAHKSLLPAHWWRLRDGWGNRGRQPLGEVYYPVGGAVRGAKSLTLSDRSCSVNAPFGDAFATA